MFSSKRSFLFKFVLRMIANQETARSLLGKTMIILWSLRRLQRTFSSALMSRHQFVFPAAKLITWSSGTRFLPIFDTIAMFKEDTSGDDGLKKHFQSHSRIRDVQGHSHKVHSVDWNSDGRRLASGSFDKTVSLYSLDRDRLSKERSFKGHEDSVDQLCWHPSQPDLLATASLDKTVRLWDTRRSNAIQTFNTKGENINISWSPDGKTIAVGNKDDLVTFIDFKGRKQMVEQQFKFEVNEISWNNSSDLFFLTSGTGEVHVLSYPHLTSLTTIKAHPATCICIEFDPTGKYFAVGSADALVSIWDANHLCCLRTMSRLEWPARTISFSHDGKLLASASEDLMIDISSSETGEKITEIQTESPTFTVAFHPRKYLLAYACDEKDSQSYSNRERGGGDAGIVRVYGFPGEA